MPPRLRRIASALVFLLLASLAWAPVLDADFARGEFRTLVETGRAMSADGLDHARAMLAIHGAGGHLLTAHDFALTHALWSRDGDWSASPVWPLRLENALLLCLGAWLLGRFAARVLMPWTGAEHARAAGWAAAALLALHPLQPASIASLDARGDLWALIFCSAAGWSFLRGRREDQPRALAAALVFAVLAGMSSDIALALGPVLAVAEYASGKRHRPQQARLRTSSTTFLVFAAATLVDTIVRSALLGRFAPPHSVAVFGSGSFVRSLAISLERLGALLLPIDQHVLGAAGFAVAGALTLIALQPVLSAARSAPRLWGWLACAWLAAFACAELSSPAARVNQEEFTHASTLFPASAVLCVGLGVAITALSGKRRILLPLTVGLGYAVLAYGNATAFRAAADASTCLREDLDAARRAAPGAELIVIDPPAPIDGIEVVDTDEIWMVQPPFSADRAVRVPARVRATSLPGFLAFAREPEFDELRARGLAVLEPADGVLPRAHVLLSKPKKSEPPLTWRREGLSPPLDVESASIRVLHVDATEEALTDRPPIVAWRTAAVASSADAESGRMRGAWTYLGAAPEAVFDLSSSLPWVLAERVKQVWSAEGWSQVGEAHLLEDFAPPQHAVEPRVEGDDWVFDVAQSSSDVHGEWWFTALDLDTLELREIRPSTATDGRLRVADMRAISSAMHGSRVAWALERRVDGMAVDRIRGRTVR